MGDPYSKKAKELGYRARSTFKLLEVNEHWDIFKGVNRAVDLCASPGSWSQCLSRNLVNKDEKSESKRSAFQIVAVDLQPIAPIDGVHIIQGDITSKATAEKIVACFEGDLADLVVCDGAPEVSGLHEIDEYVQSQLLQAALNITAHILKPDGTFVAKFFMGDFYAVLHSQFRQHFKSVICTKPQSSRATSAESFIVCHRFVAPTTLPPLSLEVDS